jgi:hypothetical protein
MIMTLAASPGMTKALLLNENLVKPGNPRRTVNFIGSQLRIAGLPE